MAATSQPLLQGGIRTRDWFSDKLVRGGDDAGGTGGFSECMKIMVKSEGRHRATSLQESCFMDY